MRSIVLLVLIVLLLSAGLFGCGDSIPNPADFGAVLKKAESVSRQANSYRYEITSITNTTNIDPLGGETTRIIESSLEEAFVFPDRAWTRTKVTSAMVGWPGEQTHTSESIIIGKKCYQRRDGSIHWDVDDDWGSIQGGMFGEATSFWLSLRFMVDVERLPNEHVRGVDCLQYKGRVDMNALVDSLPDDLYPMPVYRDWLRQSDRTVNLWVGMNDYLIRKYRTSERNPCPTMSDLTPLPGGKPGMIGTEVMEFYDYNEPIGIEAPI